MDHGCMPKQASVPTSKMDTHRSIKWLQQHFIFNSTLLKYDVIKVQLTLIHYCTLSILISYIMLKAFAFSRFAFHKLQIYMLAGSA